MFDRQIDYLREEVDAEGLRVEGALARDLEADI